MQAAICDRLESGHDLQPRTGKTALSSRFHRQAGNAAPKNRELKFHGSCVAPVSNGNSTTEINAAHTGARFVLRTALKDPTVRRLTGACCLPAHTCFLTSLSDVYTVIYLIMKRDFRNLTGHQKFAGSKENC